MSYEIFLTVLALTSITGISLGCPAEVCTCKWKGGKQTVECGGQQLQKIPETMDPGTQVLNFSGNSLQVIQSERFYKMELVNLQKIYFAHNQLIRIHKDAFRGLSNLVELDLSDNLLQTIPNDTFPDYTSLMRLSLSGNPIREIRSSSFKSLAYLTTLELSNCQIETIENEAFVGMDNLEWLRLDGNRINFILGDNILPKSLHGISLHNNRWQCNCYLVDIHAWLINYNIPLTEEPKCMEPPRLKGQTIKSLKKDELACQPEVMPKSSYTEISEGRNISIVCVVRAIPEPKVLWYFNGMALTNDSFYENLHMYYYIDDSRIGEKHSEVYIYNVGLEDNGTFSCVGQNVAGTTSSNYTLRVIVKEPPIVKEVSFSKDYMNYIIASSGCGGVIFILLVCTLAIKCHTKKSKAKSGDNVKLQEPPNTGLLKCPSIITEEEMSPKSLQKENGSVILTTTQMKQNLIMYAPSNMPPMGLQQGLLLDTVNMQLSSTPPSSIDSGPSGILFCSQQLNGNMRSYQDKNPDLINDAESGHYHNNNSTDNANYDAITYGHITATLPRNLQKFPPQRHQVDVHLNPVCFLGQDNFTYDYSNNHPHQQLQQQQQQQHHQQQHQQQNFYRTLPHKQKQKQLQFAAVNKTGARYSLEAEFLQRANTPPYDKFLPSNVRFTPSSEGYTMVQYPITSHCIPAFSHPTQPIRYPISILPAPPPSSSPASTPPPPPSAASTIPTSTSSLLSSSSSNVNNKRCVGAQTTDVMDLPSPPPPLISTTATTTIQECEEENDIALSNNSNTKLRHLSEPLADSPDEGYVGDGHDSSVTGSASGSGSDI